jgi:hypothetical protein
MDTNDDDTTTTTVLHTGRTKAGRDTINTILTYATKARREFVDLVTGKVTVELNFPVELVRKFIDVDGKHAELYEVDPTTYVYLSLGIRSVQAVRIVITTTAIPV